MGYSSSTGKISQCSNSVRVRLLQRIPRHMFPTTLGVPLSTDSCSFLPWHPLPSSLGEVHVRVTSRCIMPGLIWRRGEAQSEELECLCWGGLDSHQGRSGKSRVPPA